MHGSAQISDVRKSQFVLKIEKLSHIIAARGSQDLRSPSLIMALLIIIIIIIKTIKLIIITMMMKMVMIMIMIR